MVKLLYLEINLVGLAVLFVLRCYRGGSLGAARQQRAFDALTASLMATLALDGAMWMVDGMRFAGAREINWAVSFGYYFFNCYVPYLWMRYTALLFGQSDALMRRSGWLLAPLLLNTALLCANFAIGMVFHVDAANVYVRGSLFFLPVIPAAVYLAGAIAASAHAYRGAETRAQRRDCILMIRILILPVLGAVAQMLWYGISLIWICAVLSLLMIFINFQNRQISTDWLTGLNNRYQFNKYLQSLLESPEGKAEYALIMLDIDRFKEFNDTYGHVVGDKALGSMAEILKRSCHNTGTFLSRYGGDEFAVICEAAAAGALTASIQRHLNSANAAGETPLPLSVSVGSTKFWSGAGADADGIIAAADAGMYAQKASNHALHTQ